MAVAYTSTEISGTLGTFTGGLGGAPTNLRSTDYSKPEIIDFHFTQGASQGNVNDTIDLAYLGVTDKLYDGLVVWSAGGAGVQLDIGLVDSNNSANNSATKFMNAQNIATAGSQRLVNAGGIQVGVDPAGDQTTGNIAPNYGSGKITIQAKIVGAGLAAAATISGYLMVVRGN